MKILVVFGTRPEIIKLFPVIKELRRRNISPITCFTRQHSSLAYKLMDVLNIKPDISLDVNRNNPSINSFLSSAINMLDIVIGRTKPDYIVVQGDTTSALAGAIAGFHKRVKIAHVEAGLRSFDNLNPFPEEANRAIIDTVSDILFAPTSAAAKNINASEHQKIYVTGNTEVDALYYVLDNYTSDISVINKDKFNIIVTAHRRESIPGGIKEICRAANRLGAHPHINIIFVMHKNPLVRKIATNTINDDAVNLIEPVLFTEFVHYLANSDLVITDSGGIQEDCAVLGIPAIVARAKTERIEGIESGCAMLVQPNSVDIVNATQSLITNPDKYKSMASAPNPYGDGSASIKIVDILTGD